MDANTEIDLGDLQQAIVDAIAAQFPAFQAVVDYDESDRNGKPLPACFVELVDFEGVPDLDPGTEQLAMQARFEARIVIGFRTVRAEREIRKLAAALGAFCRLQRWGKPVGPAEVLTIRPDSFDVELDQYLVWVVEWRQVVHLGNTVWKNDGAIPTSVLYSWAPDVGVEHEGEYSEAVPTEVQS